MVAAFQPNAFATGFQGAGIQSGAASVPLRVEVGALGISAVDIALRVGPAGAAGVALEVVVAPSGAAVLPLAVQVLSYGAAAVALAVRVGSLAVLELPLSVRLVPMGLAAVPVSVTVYGLGAATVPLEVLVAPMGQAELAFSLDLLPAALASGAVTVTAPAGRAAVWGALVLVGGVDVTDQVIDEIVIEAEEGAARVADFTLRPATGTTVFLPAWSGKAVQVYLVDMWSGVPAYRQVLFVGQVDLPSVNLETGTIALRCTDDLQVRLAAMARDEIEALVGGHWSAAVFDPATGGFTYAQDRLSTRPASLDLSSAGALQLTEWAAKDTADLVFDADTVGDGSLVVECAERSAIVNQVEVAFDYRFPRVKAEGYAVSYEAVNMSNFATYRTEGRWWLQREAVVNAVSSAGGELQSVTWTPLPDENVAVGGGFWSPGASDGELCMGFAATVVFNYAQSIQESHRIVVRNEASIWALGLRRETMSGALEGEYPDTETVESAMSLFGGEISSIPPLDVAVPLAGFTTAAEVSLTPETDRAAAELAMQTLIAVGKTRIAASHRQHSVSWTVPANPAIDVAKTIAVETDQVSAKGKCRHLKHRLNPGSGEAVTEVSIAICAALGVGTIHPEDVTAAPAGTNPASTALSAPPLVVFNDGAADDHTITITFPGVEAAERARANPIIDTVIRAPLVEDVFSVTL